MAAVFYTNGVDVVVLGASNDNTFYGLDGNDFLQFNFTISLSTTIEGGNGNDSLLSSKGNDFLYGGNGDDSLDLMGGKDHGYGGEGRDTIVGDYERGEYLTSGTDTLYGGDGNDKIFAGGRGDYVSGDGGDDELWGDKASKVPESKKPGDDRIFGGDGKDKAFGQAGNDLLEGGSGDDQLTGGRGGDLLSGGFGADRFIYDAIVDSNGGTIDTIDDFRTQQGDRIDLSAIDAKVNSSGEQAFTFIGSNAFTPGVEGELRFDAGVLSADVDGDGVVDFSVNITNVAAMTDADFIL